MATYRELKAQAEKLMAQAEEQRAAEMADAISGIVAAMNESGITIADLRTHLRSSSPLPKATASKKAGSPGAAEPKYKDPKSDATWTGHGRAPAWLKALEESGKSREKYLLKS